MQVNREVFKDKAKGFIQLKCKLALGKKRKDDEMTVGFRKDFKEKFIRVKLIQIENGLDDISSAKLGVFFKGFENALMMELEILTETLKTGPYSEKVYWKHLKRVKEDD